MSATVAYVRVSSRGQDHAMQQGAIEREAAARGDTVARWYAEKRSATTNDRPELAALLADVRAGRVRKLYVFRLDRLTRTGIADTLALVKELRERQVELVNLRDGFAVPPPNASGSEVAVGQLILAVLAWAAEMELHTRKERIAARRELAEERGEAWGRPSRIGPLERAAVLERHARGETVRAIAAAVKVPRSTVGRIVATPEATAARRAWLEATYGAGSSLSHRLEVRDTLERVPKSSPVADLEKGPRARPEPPASR
jgi:DNA invertase Pin-like site-specific DNA recombinase